MQSEPQKIKDRHYNAIDLAKFLCAILVVMIHIKPFGKTVSHSLPAYLNFGATNYLARIAVPFFFVSAGFLLFRKVTLEHFNYERPKNYMIRMLRLYAIWSLIFFPISLRRFLQDISLACLHNLGMASFSHYESMFQKYGRY